MNNKKLNKILQYVFILFSLIVIVYSVLFIVNQEVNIKYYFENSLPNGSNNSIPICQKDFFLELILYAKVLLFLCYIRAVFINFLYKEVCNIELSKE